MVVIDPEDFQILANVKYRVGKSAGEVETVKVDFVQRSGSSSKAVEACSVGTSNIEDLELLCCQTTPCW